MDLPENRVLSTASGIRLFAGPSLSTGSYKCLKGNGLPGLKHDLHPECSGIFNLSGLNPKGCGQGRGILLKKRHD